MPTGHNINSVIFRMEMAGGQAVRTIDYGFWELCASAVEVSLSEKIGVRRDVAQQAESRLADSRQYHYYETFEQDQIHGDDPAIGFIHVGITLLTPSERLIIHEYYWQGKSEPRIARETNRSRSTIQTLKRRAESKLRHFLSSYPSIYEGRRKAPAPPSRLNREIAVPA